MRKGGTLWVYIYQFNIGLALELLVGLIQCDVVQFCDNQGPL